LDDRDLSYYLKEKVSRTRDNHFRSSDIEYAGLRLGDLTEQCKSTYDIHVVKLEMKLPIGELQT